MTDVIANVETFCTRDGRFTENQTWGKTKFKDLHLFNIADRDKNEVLSKDEIRRYNNPILFVYEDSKNMGSSALFTDQFKEEIANGGIPLNSLEYIEDKQQDFFVGLKRENVINKEKFLHKFDTIDSNKDYEISEEEMQDIVKIENLASEAMENLNKAKNIGIGTSFGGLLLGLIGGLTLPTLSKKPLVGKFSGLIATGAALLGAIIGNLPAQIQANKLNKEYYESMGEYKNHEYAKDLWESRSKATGLWGIFAY